MSDPRNFVIPAEMFTAMQYIHNNFSDISFNIKTKLNYLAMYLIKNFASEDERKKYMPLILATEKELNSEEEKIEFSPIRNLSPEIATKIYVDTVSTLFPSSQLVLTTLIKKATLFVRSQMLKLWGERGVELNYGKKIFVIQPSSSTKPDKVLDLLTYDLKWLGEMKSRYCFGLDSKTPKNHYKSFCLGSDKLEVAKDWYESIRLTIVGCYISTFIEQKNKREKALKKPRTQDDLNLTQKNRGQGSGVKTVKTFKQIKEEFEQKNYSNANSFSKTKKNNSQSFSENTISPYDNEDIADYKKDSFMPGLEKIEEKSHENLSTPLKSLSISHDIFFLNETHLEKKGGDLSPNFKVLESENQKVEEGFSNYFGDQQSLEQSCESNKNVNAQKKSEENEIIMKRKLLKQKKQLITIPRTSQQKKIAFKKIKKIKNSQFFLHKIILEKEKNKKIMTFLSETQNIVLDENELFYRSKNLSNSKDFDGFDMKTSAKINISNLVGHLYYKTIVCERSFLLLQEKTNKNRFKIFLSIPFNFRVLLHYLIEPKHIKEYNESIADIKLINLNNPYQNSYLEFLKLKQKNEKSLDIVFKRTLLENNEYFLINDKSIDFNYNHEHELISSKDLLNYLILISKNDQKDNNVIMDIIVNRSIIHNKEIINSLLNYFKGFSCMINYFGQKICKSLENFKSHKTLLLQKIFERKEIKIFLKEKFLRCKNKKERMDMKALYSPRLKSYKTKPKKSKSLEPNYQRNNDMKSINSQIKTEKLDNKKKTILSLIKNLQENAKLIYRLNFGEWKGILFKAPKKYFVMEKWTKKLLKQDFLKHQRGFIEVFKDFSGQEKLLKGVNLLKISLPFFMIKKETCIERVSKALCLAPLFLNEICNLSPLERIKGVTAFVVACLNILISPLIPLQNIKGDSLNLVINKDNHIYLEAIDEKIYVLFIGKLFKFYGSIQPNFQIFLNEFELGFQFNLTLVFENQKIQILETPMLKIFDDSLGNRVFNYEGRSLIYDESNEILSEILFGPNHREKIMFSFCDRVVTHHCEYKGWIKSIDKIEFSELISKKNFYIENRKNSKVKRICQIGGNLFKYITFDKQIFYEYKNIIDNSIEIGFVLPSDCLIRLDVLNFKANIFEKYNFLRGQMRYE